MKFIMLYLQHYKTVRKKMKKILLLIICLTGLQLFARQRSISDAYFQATSYLNQTPAIRQKAPATSSTLKLSHVQKIRINTNDSIATYFAFNKGNNNGYVIISGDDRATTLLGYADEGSFNYDSLPANMKYWLSNYDKELSALSQTTNPLVAKAQTETNLQTAVSPLLGTIKWNQDTPYNNLCPLIPPANTTRSVTGCVATGMAQVMMYYKWPATGTGSNTYTSATNKITSTVSFSGVNYDWTNMTPTYSSTSTDLQKNAVATLMYHCGVAVSMDYGVSSSATTIAMANALKNNFGYDQNLQLYIRNFYNRTEWKTMIMNEINYSRPVLYAGNSTDGGHLFVCDGYDNNGLFHINWGWGGSSNGYFQISALDPSVQGIGGSSGGYNSNQEILIGIQKPNATTTPKYNILTDDSIGFTSKTITRSGLFNLFSTYIYNKGINTFSGSVGVALYNESGFLGVLSSKTATLNTNIGWSKLNFSSLSIPSTYANGQYKIFLVYKANSESEWQIVRAPVGTPNYLNVELATSEVRFSTPSNSGPSLTLNSLTKTGNLYQNKTGRFNISITNNGIEYNSAIGIYLESTDNQSIYQLVSAETINIAAGETRVVDFAGNITLAPGKYYMATMYDPKNNPEKTADIIQLGNYQLVDVLAEPTATPTLSLTSNISFPNPLQVDKKLATLSATIKNATGFYDKKLIAFIFETTGGSSLTYLGYQDAILDANETKTFKFTGEINLPLKNYSAVVYYQNTSSQWTLFSPSSYGRTTFTLVDLPTGLKDMKNNQELLVYPNPVYDKLTIQSASAIKNIRIADISGKTCFVKKDIDSNEVTIFLNELNRGSYILKIETTNGFEVKKINKF